MRTVGVLVMDDDIEFGYYAGDWAILYALDAMSSSERLLIERWLDEGDSDRRNNFSSEVAAVHSTMASLSSVSAVDPPPRLRRRVLARQTQRRYLARPGGERIQRVPKFATRVAAAVAATVLVLGGVAAVVVSDRVSEGPGSTQIAESSDTRTTTTAVVGGGTIVTTVFEVHRTVAIEAHGLGGLAGGGSQLQLWLVSTTKHTTADAGRLDSRRVLTRIEDADALMVTVEPAGGSDQPTQRPVAVIWLV
jgi:anti-sigma-K factor RskA